MLLRQSIIDECFSKETVAEIIKSFVSFFICLFEIEIFHWKCLPLFDMCVFNYLQNYIRWYFTFQEAEAGKEGNGWIGPVLKGLKKSSPTGLKITLRTVINFCSCVCHNWFSYMNWWLTPMYLWVCTWYLFCQLNLAIMMFKEMTCWDKAKPRQLIMIS